MDIFYNTHCQALRFQAGKNDVKQLLKLGTKQMVLLHSKYVKKALRVDSLNLHSAATLTWNKAQKFVNMCRE